MLLAGWRVDSGRPKLRQIGAWSFFCDLAGQVQAAHNPIITVAAVAIPQELVKPARSRLVRAFGGVPVKWKVGTLDGLSKVISLILRFNLHVSVAQVHCGDPATWQGYFAQGDAFVKGAGAHLPAHDPLRAADWVPTVILKSYLLGDGLAHLNGWVVGERHPWGSGPTEVDLHLITDNDFSDTVTANTFAERIATVFPNAPSILADLGVVPVVKSSCLTEQDEPLLLLPDYLAGVYHHAEPRARLANPVVATEAARAAVADFGMRHRRIRVDEDEFDGVYPLGWDASGRAVQRPQRG